MLEESREKKKLYGPADTSPLYESFYFHFPKASWELWSREAHYMYKFCFYQENKQKWSTFAMLIYLTK